LFSGINAAKKRDQKAFTEKIKETLKGFQQIQMQSENYKGREKDYRNYGEEYEIE